MVGGWSVKTDFKAHSGSQLQLSIQVRAECGNNDGSKGGGGVTVQLGLVAMATLWLAKF